MFIEDLTKLSARKEWEEMLMVKTKGREPVSKSLYLIGRNRWHTLITKV